MHELGSRRATRARGLLVAQRRHLPAVRAQFRRRQRRRHRRPRRRAGTTCRYLAELGIDAIWFNPWYPSPMADAGYDISDYRDIDPVFGTLADADALIAEAHAARHPDHHRRRAEPLLRPASVVPGGAGRRSRVRRAGPVLVPAGPRPSTASCRRTTGSPSSAARPGPGSPSLTARPASGTCTCSRRSSPTSTGRTRTSGRSSRTCCGSGSSAAPTASGSTRRRCSPRTPPCPTSSIGRSRRDRTHPYADRDDVHDIYRAWRARRRRVPEQAS